MARSSDGDVLDDLLHEVMPGILEADGYQPRRGASDALVVAHAHVLPSFVALLRHLIEDVGFSRSDILLVPKAYSTIAASLTRVENLGIRVFRSTAAHVVGSYDRYAADALKAACRHVERRLERDSSSRMALLLDDGGMLTAHWHRLGLEKLIETVSIQQTTSGVFKEPRSPKLRKINVAGSAAKRWFEAPIIAKGVVRKVLDGRLANRDANVGIIGFGAIGRALADALNLEVECKSITVYDYVEHAKRYRNASSLRELVFASDLVFGCTGRNVFVQRESIVLKSQSKTVFVSCSSRDVEFMALLKHVLPGYNDPYGTLELGATASVVENGGFPVNFDRQREWETKREIAITRALTLGAVLQALTRQPLHGMKSTGQSAIIPLSARLQQQIVQSWLAKNEQTSDEFGVSTVDFNDLRWWQTHSFHVVSHATRS